MGGWGVRKQFGLQHLERLRLAESLRCLRFHLVGARVTCEYFKRAIQGIVALPQLHTLEIGVEFSELGEECYRGLCVLRRSTTIQRLTLHLGAPSVRLLSALGAIRYIPDLRVLTLALDMRYQPLEPGHIDAIGLLGDLIEVHLSVYHASNAASVSADVADRLRLVPRLTCSVTH